MELSYFKQSDFLDSLKKLFQTLDVPINYLSDDPIEASEILSDTYKDNDSFKLINKVYFLGIVDDAAFDGYESLNPEKIKSDYDGLLLFGVTLHKRKNDLLPTRSQLAEISRAFNRQFFYTPVVVVFNYQDDISDYLAFANTERLKYKQEWREGEKAGKVTLLRDIDINKTHAGHLRILKELRIPTTGKNKVDSFASLYQYWQDVFSVSLLNKKFYEELSNWYFWAIHEVRFPLESDMGADRSQEDRAQNVIRLLTRFLFVWFIKEKQLIPQQFFDQNYIESKLLKDFNPYNKDDFLHSPDINSHYYKAILQNLFFATLNQEMGKRAFRRNKQNMNVTNLLRYQPLFKDPDHFIELVETIVPFMNGGLFECLDKPHPTQKGRQGGDVIIYEDGFSDRPDNKLIVPDYLFFGAAHTIDLSSEYGSKAKKYKQAAVKGLIKIFESYKFTIAENTPIEEDVALDPELLGKVFENLLASYNPETKTTARKQTGSFYTPREIVNYMVDESLIAHLKTNIEDWQASEADKDQQLHQLLSFDSVNPFAEDSRLQKKIINALDHCKILDPACGSGAFPMGILQKMVHILQKVDPDNAHWKQLQIDKAKQESANVFEKTTNKEERQQQLDEINEAFDNKVNDPDYARKLFLIENCIYGVDIQPIAIQISKLRFFISLVVEQKVDADKPNFGIRPLPNLEATFIAANSLISIDKHENYKEVFESDRIKELEHKRSNAWYWIFYAKDQKTKKKYRKIDQESREEMAKILVESGMDENITRQLVEWKAYDQNEVSSYFSPEWMFRITDGFDIVIGNPPYIQIQKFSGQQCQKDWEKQAYQTYVKTGDIYSLFYEKGNDYLKDNGHLCYITSNKWMRAKYGMATRRYFLNAVIIEQLIDFGDSPIFEAATTYTNILLFKKANQRVEVAEPRVWDLNSVYQKELFLEDMMKHSTPSVAVFSQDSFLIMPKQLIEIKNQIEAVGTPLKEWDISIYRGVLTGFNEAFIISKEKKEALITADPKSAEILKPVLRGKDIKRYKAEFADLWLIATFPALNLDIDDYPAVKQYLETYLPKLKQTGESFTNSDGKQEKTRKKTGNKWFETQDQISYFNKFEKNKIVWPETSKDNQFYLDENNYFLDKTCFLMLFKEKFILVILNSMIAKFYLSSLVSKMRGGYFSLSKIYVEQLPIPTSSLDKHYLLNILTDLALYEKSDKLIQQSKTFENVINGTVFQLYFPDHMQEKQIDIADLVKADLNEVLQNRAFESLSTTEKETVINQLHRKWTHPDNKVRNRIKLFAVRSPDILKPILESQP